MDNYKMYDEYYLADSPPEGGAERQRYFIEKLKIYLADYKAEHGTSLTYQIQTFGCQMNFHDSERLDGILSDTGLTAFDSEEADIVIFNTCTIRENANQKLYGHLGRLKNLKQKNKSKIIAICGCMMQEPTVIETIKKKYPFVDIVFGTFNFHRIAEFLFRHIESGERIIEVEKEFSENVENLPVKRKYPFKSGLNIMYGCNNFCTYCIVPYVRGRERSRTPEDILDEARRLVHSGVSEIMLLGQNVNSYGVNFLEESAVIQSNPGYSFPNLLRDVAHIEGLKRLRFMTSHPKDLSDELIQVMKEEPVVCNYIHLPLQSGSSRILKKMNRTYTRDGYIQLLEKIKKEIPDIAVSTDIIVGFPGETEEDFEDTLSLVDMADYEQAFTFIYSKRTGTPAASYEDQVDDAVIKERFSRLLEHVNVSTKNRVARYKDRVLPVLFEEEDKELAGYITGRTEFNTTVHVKGSTDLIGKIANVKMTEHRGFYYIGELTED